jgi:hypothetical protein
MISRPSQRSCVESSKLWPTIDRPRSKVTVEQGQKSIQTAQRFVASLASLIPANGHTPSAPKAPKT